MGIFSRERFIMRGEQRSDCCTRFLTLTRKTTEEVRGSPPSACSSSGAGGTSQIPMHHVRTRGQALYTERLWKEFISDPSQWWDNRLVKRHTKYPDFKHRRTKEALWVDKWSNPPWVNSELIAIALGEKQPDDASNFQVPHGAPGEDCRGTSSRTTRGRMREGVTNISLDTGPLIREGGTIDMLQSRDKKGIPVHSLTYVKLLQKCIKERDLAVGKQIHDHIVHSEVQPNNFLSNTLINMYTKCGSVVGAQQVFDRIVKKDVVSWNLLIGGYAQHGHVKEAVTLFRKMRQEGLEPNRITYMSILNAFSCPATLVLGKEVHADIIKAGFQSEVRVKTALVSMYAKCGSIRDARVVFDGVGNRDSISWNTMIGVYARHGHYEEAFGIYRQMLQVGLKPDHITYASVLNACCNPAALERGLEVHAHITGSGLHSNLWVGTALINMYAKCGSIKDARLVFDKMVKRNVVSWTALIEGYAQHGHSEEAYEVFRQMQRVGLKPNHITYMSILNACGCPTALERGKEVHGDIIKAGYQSDVSVGNALVNMYAKCGGIRDARLVFDKLRKRDIISWNTMIGSYAQHGHYEEAFKVFNQMQRAGVKPNQVTYINILNACSCSVALKWGQEVHGHIIDAGLHSHVCVGNALINMYAKCGSIRDARLVFDGMVQRDIISWTGLIEGYAQHGLCEEAFEVFLQMQQVGMKPNPITYISILSACSSPAALKRGQEVHAHIIESRFQNHVSLGNALVNMYAKCGSIRDAQLVFDGMGKRNVISWTALIEGYGEHGHCEKAFEIFREMQQVGLKPNQITYMSILNACACPTALERGKEVHADIITAGLQSDVRLGTALVNMYAKCGSIKDARLVFAGMVSRNVVTWNAMIGGLALYGYGLDALHMFEQMKKEGVRPDSVTFVGVLSACSHAGLVVEGRGYFNAMSQDHGILPTIVHYGCLVDLLGRAGHLDEAENIIKSMPMEAGAAIWGALLSACKLHGNVMIAERAADCSLKIEPQNVAVYVLLSNIYAAAGMWGSVAKVRKLMKERGVLKQQPGRSWIEVDKEVHSFVVGDRSHPQSEEIYSELKSLTEKMKRAGYVPDMRLVMHEVEEEQKEEAVCHHSEKLAIAYGLIRTPSGTPIRISKNLRICADCHTATKFVTKIVGREIIARDASRFHHFKDGVCSCGDYW